MTAAYRFNDDGKACALSEEYASEDETFKDHGEILEGLFIW